MKTNRLVVMLVSFLLVVMTFVSCGETAQENTPVLENGNVEISFVDGKIFITGSLDNNGNLTGKYTVNYVVVNDGNEDKAKNVKRDFDLVPGENTFEIEFGVFSKNQTVRASVNYGDETVCQQVEKNIKSLRLLSVGNSFSVDAQQHLYGIAKDMGYDNIILGNLYIGGCSLEGHYSVYVNERNSYTYYKNVGGEMTEKPETSFMEGLLDEKWDYITLQQASPTSGKSESYEPYLSNLVKVIKQNKTNPNAEILWHMTWAYAGDSTYEHFKNYDYDQEKMYNCIVNATKENISDNSDIAFVIPSGTAIQNARNSELGDTLCRDGFHLDLGYGRYLASLTWMHKISGESIDNVTYIPDNMFDEKTLEVLKVAAKNAVANPFEVTK